MFEKNSVCKSIGRSAFYYCNSLTSINIPDSVETIGVGAFTACTALTSIVIGSRITSIDAYAFSYNPALTTVYYAGTAAQWNSITIDASDDGNKYLTEATRYYYSATQPSDTENKYWHYVDGEIVVWPV